MVNLNQFLTGKSAFSRSLLVSSLLLAGGCASTGSNPDQANKAAETEKSSVDPYESFNRSMFKFNDHLDDYVAKPISDAYIWATPVFLKSGVSNFFSNLKDINVVLNDHMQGKFEQGAEDTGRFLTNSTVGLLGFFDVATDLGLKKHEEDFGQTLAVWGVPQGAYLVLPVLGPTTTRGLPGSIVDTAANPSTYVGMPVQLVSMLNARANAEGALKFIDEASIDPYVFTREAYLQNQHHLITDGQGGSSVDILPMEDDFTRELEADDAPKKAGGTAVKESQTGVALDNAVAALDKASTSFEESSEKLDKLSKKRKHHRHPAKKVLPPAPAAESNPQ